MSAARGNARALLEVHDLKKHFPVRGGLFGTTSGYVYAVDGVSFDIAKGETLSLVGESGCGKSTVGKAILRLYPVTAGEVFLGGDRIDNLPVGKLRPLRRRIQVVFQDPVSASIRASVCAISLPNRSSISDWLPAVRSWTIASDS